MKLHITRLPLIPALLGCAALLSLILARYAAFPLAVESLVGGSTYLGLWLERVLSGSRILSAVIMLCLIFINAVIVTRTMISNMIVVAHTYLPLIIYVILSCGIYCSQYGVTTALCATLVLLAMQFMIRGFRRRPSIDLFFKASLLIGFTPLLYAPSMFYGAMIPVAVWLFRRSAREMTVSVVGFVLPSAIAAYILWATGEPFLDLYKNLWTSIATPSGYRFLSIEMGLSRLVIWCLLILLTSLSIGTFAAHMNNMRTRQRRVYSAHLYLLAISFGILLLPCSTPAVFPLLAMPMSVVLQTFFVKYAGTLSSILYLLLIAAVVLLNVGAWF